MTDGVTGQNTGECRGRIKGIIFRYHFCSSRFWSTWSQLVESLDPFGEKNALKVMDLKAGSSQEEIRSRYRELSKQFHPDKVQGTQEEKEAANEKFVQIQQVNRDELRFLSFL